MKYASEIISAIVNAAGDGLSPVEVLNVLEDGETLRALGVTDEDQILVELAHEIVGRLGIGWFTSTPNRDDVVEAIRQGERVYVASHSAVYTLTLHPGEVVPQWTGKGISQSLAYLRRG